jgi:hypothetical protein
VCEGIRVQGEEESRAGRGKQALVCATMGESRGRARAVRGVRGWHCGSVDPLMMEDRGLIRRSLAIGSWVSVTPQVFCRVN